MKSLNVIVLAACAGTSIAMAAPRETADLVLQNGGPIGSKDLPGSVNNTTLTVNFTGSDGGGSYTANYLNMSGTISAVFGASYLREAVVKVTPPGGTPFFAQLMNLGASGTVPTSGTVAVVPVSSFTTAGAWTFEFCDYFNDVTTGDFIDASWTAFSVSLDDGAIPAPAVGAGPSMTFTNLPSDGLVGAAANGVANWNNAVAGSFNGIRLSGIVTSGGTDPAANLNANLTPDFRIQVTAPNGSITQVAPIAGNGLSSQPFDITIGFAGTPVGNWNFRTYESADILPIVDNYAASFTAELVTIPPPSPTIPIALVNGSTVTDTQAYTASQVRWYTFSLTDDITAAANRALEIDTEGSAAANPSMGLYDLAGNRVGTDFDDGSGTQAQLSFGLDGRAAVGTGVVYDGRDGALLASGSPYYLAVMTSNGTYGPATWGLTTGTGAAANATVNFRYFDPSSTVPTATDLGALVAGVPTSTTATLAAGETKWLKFTLGTQIAIPINTALEIDTVGSTAGATTGAGNTGLALYSSAGVRIVTDTVDGAGSLACLSFGLDNRVADPAVGTDAAGVAYNGRDAASLTPGVYYLAVSAGDTGVVFNPAFFVANTSTVTGSVTVNLNLKDPSVTPTNPATPTIDTSLGRVMGTSTGAEGVTQYTFTGYATGNQVKWLSFNTAIMASDATGFYLDIDTEGTTAGGLDTEIALYHSNGLYSNEDDDDASGLLSALSYGDTTPVRAMPVAGGTDRNGRDGPLPADTYYLAVGRFNFTMPIDNFGVTSSSTAAAGDIVVNFRTNLPCSAADVGVQGGGAGQDHLLNNNDFIAFIDLFFSSNVKADLGKQGGIKGSDGLWDNNDFIVFIDYFFADTASCTG